MKWVFAAWIFSAHAAAGYFGGLPMLALCVCAFAGGVWWTAAHLTDQL